MGLAPSIPFEPANLSGPDQFGNYTYKFPAPMRTHTSNCRLHKFQVQTRAGFRAVEAGRDPTSIRFYLIDPQGKVVLSPQKIDDIVIEPINDLSEEERKEMMRQLIPDLKQSGLDPKDFGASSWDELYERLK